MIMSYYADIYAIYNYHFLKEQRLYSFSLYYLTIAI